jgi:hypothetical protein
LTPSATAAKMTMHLGGQARMETAMDQVGLFGARRAEGHNVVLGLDDVGGAEVSNQGAS